MPYLSKSKHNITSNDYIHIAAAHKACLPAKITQKPMKSSNNWTFIGTIFPCLRDYVYLMRFIRYFPKIGTGFASCRVLRDIVPSVACPMLSNDVNFFRERCHAKTDVSDETHEKKTRSVAWPLPCAILPQFGVFKWGICYSQRLAGGAEVQRPPG